MADIWMCDMGAKCPISLYCKRNTATKNPYRQQYGIPDFDPEKKTCSDFYSNEKFLSTFKMDFTQFAAKAPVNIHSVAHKTRTYAQKLWPFFLASERLQINVALSHSFNGEGRDEFDKVIQEVSKRLGFYDRTRRKS